MNPAIQIQQAINNVEEKVPKINGRYVGYVDHKGQLATTNAEETFIATTFDAETRPSMVDVQ